MTTAPLQLVANQPADRFYRGGAQIASFRGTANPATHEPEDWLGSTTCLHGEPRLGLSYLPDGRLLGEAVEADPEHWLGADHVAAFGADTKLLTKLLDTGERLLVHVHPDTDFARARLGRPHGKSEAWVVLTPGTVHLGFTRTWRPDELLAAVEAQEIDALMAAMHPIELHPGDTVFVPAGTPHAIGEGILLVEVQEPEDLSILLEWRGFAIDGPALGHLGIGFEEALQAVRHEARTPTQLEALVNRTPGRSRLVPEADEWFRVEALDAEHPAEAGFGVVVVTEGTGTLRGAWGETAVRAGETWLFAHACGAASFEGGAQALFCRPPAAPARTH